MKGSISADPAAGGILHVPYTYFPDPCGGTEVYVRGLAQRLSGLGYKNAVAAPAAASATYEHAGLPVYRFATDLRPRVDLAYGVSDDVAAEGFKIIVAQTRPDIVHLHARTAAVSERLVDIAHASGARVVFTYHTPTASCARGTMMVFGEKACDGLIETKRCTACTLAGLGAWKPVAQTIGTLSAMLGAGVAEKAAQRGLPKALRLPLLIGSHRRAFDRFMDKVERIVAVCRWVADVVRINGLPESKLTLCRNGLPNHPNVFGSLALPEISANNGILRLGYFGRLDPTKGIDLLIEAIRRAPDAEVRLAIHGVRQPGSEAYAARLESAAAADRRISMEATLPANMVVDTMRGCDFVVVPSRGLETGPLVVLESFAAGTPVLGARLGGIAELVTDGVDGMLFAPDDPSAWSTAIAELAGNADRISRLRAGVRPPRTMEDVAREMAALYRVMLVDDAR